MPLHAELTAAAVVALVALICGVAMARLKQTPVIGYILAGVLLGPSGFGVVEDRKAVDLLAEFGVLMLLFVVGMELNLRRFVTVWRVAVSATVLQILGSVGVVMAIGLVTGWSSGTAVLFGFVLAISSTAVVIKTLESTGDLSTQAGRVTLGVLVTQDMAVVPMTLTLAALSQGSLSWHGVAQAVLSVVFLALLVLFLVRRKLHLPFTGMAAEDGDLGPLTGLAWCFGAAALAGLVNLSPAYGAFLAGLVIGNSAQRAVVLQAVHPIQSVLIMLFFLSIGLLVDVGFIAGQLGTVLLLLALVTVCKMGFNVLVLRALGQPWEVAFLSGVALAQIGEFSFLLSQIGLSYGLVSPADARLVVAVTVLSLLLGPLWLVVARRLHDRAQSGMTRPGELLGCVLGRGVQGDRQDAGSQP